MSVGLQKQAKVGLNFSGSARWPENTYSKIANLFKSTGLFHFSIPDPWEGGGGEASGQNGKSTKKVWSGILLDFED